MASLSTIVEKYHMVHKQKEKEEQKQGEEEED
jgi:hypothetical protein